MVTGYEDKVRITVRNFHLINGVKKTTVTQSTATKPILNPSPNQLKKSSPNIQSTIENSRSVLRVAELIAQGKSLYRTAKFKQALTKFEFALKQEPNSDEALGLAGITAFRLDNQEQSRNFFLRRAALPDQKGSVKAFCYYRVALTYWREAHAIITKFGNIEDGKPVYNLPEQERTEAAHNITNGLEFVDRALAVTLNFAEGYNVKNLLHAEAAYVERDKEKSEKQRNSAIESLRRSIELTEMSAGWKRSGVTDFSQPTIRISEFAKDKEEEERHEDPLMNIIKGGRPIKRLQATFPSTHRSDEESGGIAGVRMCSG